MDQLVRYPSEPHLRVEGFLKKARSWRLNNPQSLQNHTISQSYMQVIGRRDCFLQGLPANAHLNPNWVPQRASEAPASQWPVVSDHIPAIIPAVFPVNTGEYQGLKYTTI
jgi:hypothetical protein